MLIWVITISKQMEFITFAKKVSENDQEIPQSQTADHPTASRGRATGQVPLEGEEVYFYIKGMSPFLLLATFFS